MGPVDGLRDSGPLGHVELTDPSHRRGHLLRKFLGNFGGADPDDLDLTLQRRVVDPVVQTSPLQRVVQLAGPVRRDDHRRRPGRRDPSDLGDGYCELRQHLEKERLEFVVGTVQLIHEQHRGVAGPDRCEEGPLDQELLAEKVAEVARCVLRLERPHRDELARVVPFVQRLARVDTLVALEPDQPSGQGCGQGFGYLRLPHTGLALQQQRLVQRQRQVDGHAQAVVRQVGLVAQSLLDVVGRDRSFTEPCYGSDVPQRTPTNLAGSKGIGSKGAFSPSTMEATSCAVPPPRITPCPP